MIITINKGRHFSKLYNDYKKFKKKEKNPPESTLLYNEKIILESGCTLVETLKKNYSHFCLVSYPLKNKRLVRLNLVEEIYKIIKM